MSLLVIGGNARKVGKTSVMAALIAALPELRWTAVKISELHAGECSSSKENCGCAADEHAWAVSMETDRSGASDTSRFLAASAERALWARAKPGHLADAMPELRRQLTGAANVMMESNSVLEFLRPDIYLMVLDFSKPDFKESARHFVERADALILVSRGKRGKPPDKDFPEAILEQKPTFEVSPPAYTNADLVTWMRSRLQG